MLIKQPISPAICIFIACNNFTFWIANTEVYIITCFVSSKFNIDCTINDLILRKFISIISTELNHFVKFICIFTSNYIVELVFVCFTKSRLIHVVFVPSWIFTTSNCTILLKSRLSQAICLLHHLLLGNLAIFHVLIKFLSLSFHVIDFLIILLDLFAS